MGWFQAVQRRRSVRRVAVVGVAALLVTGCSSSEDSAPVKEEQRVGVREAREAMSGVEVSEGNALRLYPSASHSASVGPTQARPSDMIDESSGAIRNRTLSELGYRASVDPEICRPVRDLAVSYLTEPTPGSKAEKAVSDDNLTAVTVTLKDSEAEAREEINRTADLYTRCREMALSVSGVNLQLRVSPLNIDVDASHHSAAMVSGSVMGAPLKTLMVQASSGNAVVTVTYFDSDYLISGQEGRSPMPSADLERQAAQVANTVVLNLRDSSA